MIKYILLLNLFCFNLFAQYQEATITRTFGTNSVYPRQFPSMTARKMNENEYWLFDSLGTNTIFHRQFPSFIVRKQNYGDNHPSQKWAVYRTYGTNTVYPNQFPDRYISSFNPSYEQTIQKTKDANTSLQFSTKKYESTYNSSSEKEYTKPLTYSKSLRSDKKASYNPESPE